MKQLLTLAVVASLAASATSACAESLADTIMARPSAEASAGVHFSLGGKAHQQAKPVYGASLGFRSGGQTVGQSLEAPVAKVAEFNVSGGKVEEARLGSSNFASSQAAGSDSPRLNFGDKTSETVLGIAIGIGILLLIADYQSNNTNNDY